MLVRDLLIRQFSTVAGCFPRESLEGLLKYFVKKAADFRMSASRDLLDIVRCPAVRHSHITKMSSE